MKKIIFIVSLCSITTIYPFWPFDNLWQSMTGGVVNGAATYKNTTLEKLHTVNGALTAYKTIIKQNITVSGYTKLEECQLFGSFIGAGALKCDETVFQKQVDVSGSVEAKKSTFQSMVLVKGSLEAETSIFNNVGVSGSIKFSDTIANDIRASGVMLKDSQVNNITITSMHKGKVTLKGKNTKVLGIITFESEEGIVYLDKQVTLDKKQVHGGTIKYK